MKPRRRKAPYQPKNLVPYDRIQAQCAAVEAKFSLPEDREMRDAIVASLFRLHLLQLKVTPKPAGGDYAQTTFLAHVVKRLHTEHGATVELAAKITAEAANALRAIKPTLIPATVVSPEGVAQAFKRLQKSGGTRGVVWAGRGTPHKQFQMMLDEWVDRLAADLHRVQVQNQR